MSKEYEKEVGMPLQVYVLTFTTFNKSFMNITPPLDPMPRFGCLTISLATSLELRYFSFLILEHKIQTYISLY